MNSMHILFSSIAFNLIDLKNWLFNSMYAFSCTIVFYIYIFTFRLVQSHRALGDYGVIKYCIILLLSSLQPAMLLQFHDVVTGHVTDVGRYEPIPSLPPGPAATAPHQ